MGKDGPAAVDMLVVQSSLLSTLFSVRGKWVFGAVVGIPVSWTDAGTQVGTDGMKEAPKAKQTAGYSETSGVLSEQPG